MQVDVESWEPPATGIQREVWEEVTATEEVPLTWWDHFKAERFPPWLLARSPAKTRVIECVKRVVHVCPHVPGGALGEHLTFVAYDPPGEPRGWKGY